MRLIALFVLLSVALTTEAASFRWKRAVEVEDVEINLNVVSPSELQRVQRDYANVHRNDFSTKGFSILYRNTETGGFRCEIFVTNAAKEYVEHETRHCYGWVHQ